MWGKKGRNELLEFDPRTQHQLTAAGCSDS